MRRVHAWLVVAFEFSEITVAWIARSDTEPFENISATVTITFGWFLGWSGGSDTPSITDSTPVLRRPGGSISSHDMTLTEKERDSKEMWQPIAVDPPANEQVMLAMEEWRSSTTVGLQASSICIKHCTSMHEGAMETKLFQTIATVASH